MPLWLPVAKKSEYKGATDAPLFVLQAWHELLHPQTPDSFRARVLDLSLLLDDLLHVVSVCENDRRWSPHLLGLADELNDLLQAEQRLVNSGSQLHRAIEAIVIDARQERVGSLKAKILIAQGLYGKPEKRLGDDLRQLLSDNGPLKKSAVLRRLSTIASHVLYRGLGEQSLAQLNEGILNNTPVEIVDQIFSSLNPQNKTFTCLIALDGDHKELVNILGATPFKRVNNWNKQGSSLEISTWRNDNFGALAAYGSVDANSSNAAAEKSIQCLTEILNVHNLYKNSAAFRVRPTILVSEPNGNPFLVTVTPSNHFGLLARNKAVDLTINRFNNIGARLQGRISNALECHAIALAAEDPRTAIINLWTALETIAGALDGQPIGKRVASIISPLVAWRRIDKIVTYLAVCVHEVLVKQHVFVDRKCMPRSSYTKISQDDVLQAITGPENNVAITYLLKISEISPLLRQRLFYAWKSFSDPRSISKGLISSRQSVDWQIQRIYRARNLLVHKGEQSHLIWRLLQNTQYYVSISLSRVLHDLSEHPTWGVDESLGYQAMRFDHVYQTLQQSSGKGLTHFDVLGSRSKDMHALLWP